ncbi:MAG TPA: DUF1269 domain-containing protein [Bryobacteraceae bacterium]|nr:DUF1269 domain-containing protein [Bryobacteraceae bacterium]
MEKMLVVVFDDEVKAYQGIQALGDLHTEGSISVFACAVISKDSEGKIHVRQEVDRGPFRLVAGMAVGSLIGLLGGPVGLVIGGVTGTLLGAAGDLAKTGVGADFLEEVSQQLQPGKSAIVAEIEETWVIPVDTRMEAIGGAVIRRPRAEIIDEERARELAARRKEIDNLKIEYEQSTSTAKANAKAKLEVLESRFEALQARTKDTIESLQREGETKVEAMQEQARTATEQAKANLQQRAAELRTEYERRSGKLKEALELTKDALKP